MNSKELLENLDDNGNYYLLPVRIYKQIKQDLERLEQLEKENKELHNQILSLELDTCIPDLRKENTKLKKVLEILKVKKIDWFELKFSYSINEYNILARNSISTLDELTQEEYELLKSILEEK